MKAYYDAHESAYREIQRNGFVGWGDVRSLEDLGDAVTRDFLTWVRSVHFAESAGATALDLGCGTGTTAFVLAQLGFVTSGVDISSTAIAMAKDLAQRQRLQIDFRQADILRLEDLAASFDLVYDSHCLHCIVFDEDRARVLSGVRSVLAPGGKFVLDTMIHREGYDLSAGFETLRLDADGILWHKTAEPEVRGVVKVDGQLWCAQRRVRTREQMLAELKTAGFKAITDYEPPERSDDAGMLRLVLTAE
jgi:SAM-dependent methyltransferase